MFKAYELDLDIQVALHKKHFKKQNNKVSKKQLDQLITMDSLVQYNFDNNPQSYSWSPQFSMYIMENRYLDSDRKVVFVDDAEANTLLNMRFNAKHLNALLANGCQTVMLCLKTTFKVRGIRLYSSLNVIDTAENFEKEYRKTVSQFVSGINFGQVDKPDDILIKVATNCRDGLNNYVAINSEQLIKLMSLTLDECFVGANILDIVPSIADILLKQGDRRQDQARVQEEEEQIAMLLNMRLTLAYYLYNQMTENKYLVSGCPHKRKAFTLNKYSYKQFAMSAEYKQKVLHLRAGHYRQLIDDRYYKNEHANKAKGSRWVEVKPAVIGKAESFVQEVKGNKKA